MKVGDFDGETAPPVVAAGITLVTTDEAVVTTEVTITSVGFEVTVTSVGFEDEAISVVLVATEQGTVTVCPEITTTVEVATAEFVGLGRGTVVPEMTA